MKADFSDFMSHSDVLIHKAEAVLRKKLLADQKNENTLWELAEVLRQKGELESALGFYQKLLGLKPDHQQAKLLSTIISQQPVTSLSYNGIRPAPYVYKNNFLSDEKQQHIWKIIKENNEFSDALVDKEVNKSYRNSHFLYGENLKDISGWFLEAVRDMYEYIWPRLPTEPFTPSREELQLTMHQDGEFFKIHTDENKTGEVSKRTVTFVYYLHREPKQYSGGDLLLFDTDSDQDFCTTKYTRFLPINNCIIFFPSNIYHQVTPVSCDSSHIENGRFTLNGWLHN